jgi:hypothetical protein
MGVGDDGAGHARSRRVGSAAALAIACAACAGDPLQPIVAPASPPAGTVLEWRTVNAYNGEPRAPVRQRIDAAGSRVEGVDFRDASEAPFGHDRAPVVAWRLDARGDLAAVERADGSQTRYTPSLPLLPPRLAPGARSRAVVTATEDDGRAPRRMVITTRVAGWETVRVPAGEFRALRILRDWDLGDGAMHRTAMLRQEVDWYAPREGAVVRREETSVFYDTSTGGGEGGGWLPRAGDWLRWELLAVTRP